MSCKIYGREEVEFTLNIQDSSNNFQINQTPNSVQSNSTKWTIQDSFLDGVDNTLVVENDKEDKVTKVFQSPNVKEIKTVTEFDDGWGNIYEHETLLNVFPEEYAPPALDFSWTPTEPTIFDVVLFSQVYDDRRNEDLGLSYGQIQDSTFDYNGFFQETINKNGEGAFNFSTKQDNMSISLTVNYNNGWEIKQKTVSRLLNMSNIPPESLWQREDKGVCIPAYEWTATSTDVDDDNTTLKYEWRLFQKIKGTEVYNLVHSQPLSSEKFYTYPFQFEGSYRIVLKTVDLEGDFSEKIEDFEVLFKECSGDSGTPGGGGELSGTLRLQLGGFQLIAIPAQGKKVSDLVDLIAEKANVQDFEIVSVCNAAPGLSGSIGNMLNYIPGETNKLSSNNFSLVMNDGYNDEFKEITGFWIHMKDIIISSGPFSGKNYVDIEWNANGELK